MTYNGTLVMPSSYAVMDTDEMTYVDGGGTISVTLKKEFLRDVVTASCSMIGTIIGGLIGSLIGPGMATVIGGAAGAAIGWIVGGSLSRKWINKDLKFSFWIPIVKNCKVTIW